MANLREAVANNDLDRTRILVNAGADILQKSGGGWTLLHHALEKGNLEMVKLLIELGANILDKTIADLTILHYASYLGRLEIVIFLIESCMLNTNIFEKDKSGYTALHYASEQGYLEIVKYLVKVYIDVGADINILNNQGNTPIDIAKTEEIKEFLIEQSEIQQNSYVLK